MLKCYKKHIAFFFALLFVASQFNYAVHALFEHHESEHHCEVSLQKNTHEDHNVAVYEESSFNNSHEDCPLCQQYQSIKLYSAKFFTFIINSKMFYDYKSYIYIKPLFSSHLFGDISLRGPPSIIVT